MKRDSDYSECHQCEAVSWTFYGLGTKKSHKARHFQVYWWKYQVGKLQQKWVMCYKFQILYEDILFIPDSHEDARSHTEVDSECSVKELFGSLHNHEVLISQQ